MKTVNVAFVDFWPAFEEESYVFFELFQKQYHQYIVSSSPDVVFFSWFGSDNQKHQKCTRIFYSGENRNTSMASFDYSFTHEDTTSVNFQLPNFARCKNYFEFTKQVSLNEYQTYAKTKFCNFIYRSRAPQERIQFCKQLSQALPVDCPGQVLNNMPNFTQDGRKSKSWQQDKYDFIKQYKFTIAFENTSAPNYVTEKIFDPFYVGSIPIYWGAPNITEFFDPASFINVRDYSSYGEAIEHIKEINESPELYNRMRMASPIHSTSKLQECNEANILKRFAEIIK